MSSSGKGEENTRYAEVYRSEENSRYSERLSAKESAGYKEYSAVGSETNATAKAPSFPKRASRKKKTTTKLVAALLVSAGAAVVTVTAVMAMVSVALLGIAVDADSLTATVEIDNPSGVELVATLSNRSEYREFKLPSSGTAYIEFNGLSEATEYVFAVRAASGGSAYFSQNVATATKTLYAFDENSNISFHTAELGYIIDESVADNGYTVEISEHGIDKTLAEYTLDPLAHTVNVRGLVSDTSYDVALVDASGNTVYSHTFKTAFAPSRIVSVNLLPSSITFKFLTAPHDYDSISIRRSMDGELSEVLDLTEEGEHEIVFEYLNPGELHYFVIEFYSSNPAVESSSEMRSYMLPAILELKESAADYTVYALTQAAYDLYDGNLVFECFEDYTYYEWLPVIYDKEAGTVTVLHEYASRDRRYLLEINDGNAGSAEGGAESDPYICMIEVPIDTSDAPVMLQPTVIYEEVDSVGSLSVTFEDYTKLPTAPDGSLVFDIAILLFGNVETQVIENFDLTGAGQFDGNWVTFTVNINNVTEYNSRYVAEFRIRSDDPKYADYSYLVAYADFSYNP